MAKTKKKPVPAKSAPKKTAAAKSVAKPAAKHTAAKKPVAKAAAKSAKNDAKHKKPIAGKVAKASEKSAAKKAVSAPPAKTKAGASVPAKKAAAAASAKPEKKAPEKETKKASPEPATAKAAAPKKGVAPKKAGKPKKEDADTDDDFVSDDDFAGADEIGEYEEELKAVEELDEESVDDEAWATESKDKGDEEIILTDAEGRRYCRSRDCDQIGIVDGYCRYHYLLFWKKIQVRKKILADGKLERYVEELTARYPNKFLEMIRRDLRTEKDFLAAIQELEIDESAGENEFEEDTNAYIEEVRGMGEGGSTGVDEEEF